MSTNELIQRRAAMMQSRGGGIDWETIARGMLDGTTPFEVPDGVGLVNNSNWLWYRSNLTSLVIPSTMTAIANAYCQGCSGLLHVTIGENITSIGTNAFRDCSHITEMIFEGTTPPTLTTTSGASGSLGNPNLTFPIYVPDSAVSAYQSAASWVNYASRVKGISERPT